MLEYCFNKVATLLKRDFITGVFLLNLQKFSEHPFLQNTYGFLLQKMTKFRSAARSSSDI